jgi:hypothetical protein
MALSGTASIVAPMCAIPDDPTACAATIGTVGFIGTITFLASLADFGQLTSRSLDRLSERDRILAEQISITERELRREIYEIPTIDSYENPSCLCDTNESACEFDLNNAPTFMCDCDPNCATELRCGTDRFCDRNCSADPDC